VPLKPENWIAIGSAVFSALVAGFGLYYGPKLAVQRAIEQFRSTRWWEKQQEAYMTILKHLSTIKYDASMRCDDIEMGLSRGPSDFLREQFRTAYYELELYTAQQDFLITTRAAKALTDFHAAVEKWNVGSAPDFYGPAKEVYETAERCIAIISDEAKLLR